MQKYLEIEINAMQQFDVKKSSVSKMGRKKAHWKGFIVAPSHGTVGTRRRSTTAAARTRTAPAACCVSRRPTGTRTDGRTAHSA